MTIEHLKIVLTRNLHGFEDFIDFQHHCQRRFPLLPDECRSLYEVLVKLQSLGYDAMKTLDTWQRDMAPAECAEFIRLLIRVEEMEIDDLLKAA